MSNIIDFAQKKEQYANYRRVCAFEEIGLTPQEISTLALAATQAFSEKTPTVVNPANSEFDYMGCFSAGYADGTLGKRYHFGDDTEDGFKAMFYYTVCERPLAPYWEKFEGECLELSNLDRPGRALAHHISHFLETAGLPEISPYGVFALEFLLYSCMHRLLPQALKINTEEEVIVLWLVDPIRQCDIYIVGLYPNWKPSTPDLQPSHPANEVESN